MIHFLRDDYQAMLANPSAYVTDEQDIALVRIVPANNPNNSTLIMVGQDPWDERYLLVVEDNDVSQDIYPESDATLYDTFFTLFEALAEADRLMDILYKASTEANVQLNVRDGDGNPIPINAHVTEQLNKILEQAYLPAMVDSIIAAGYRRENNGNTSDWTDIVNLLIDEYISEDVRPAYYEYDQCIDCDDRVMDLIYKILIHGYIPFIAKTTIEAGYVQI